MIVSSYRALQFMMERLLQGTGDLNGRQLALLTDAVRHPDAIHTFASHA